MSARILAEMAATGAPIIISAIGIERRPKGYRDHHGRWTFYGDNPILRDEPEEFRCTLNGRPVNPRTVLRLFDRSAIRPGPRRWYLRCRAWLAVPR